MYARSPFTSSQPSTRNFLNESFVSHDYRWRKRDATWIYVSDVSFGARVQCAPSRVVLCITRSAHTRNQIQTAVVGRHMRMTCSNRTHEDSLCGADGAHNEIKYTRFTSTHTHTQKGQTRSKTSNTQLTQYTFCYLCAMRSVSIQHQQSTSAHSHKAVHAPCLRRRCFLGWKIVRNAHTFISLWASINFSVSTHLFLASKFHWKQL